MKSPRATICRRGGRWAKNISLVLLVLYFVVHQRGGWNAQYQTSGNKQSGQHQALQDQMYQSTNFICSQILFQAFPSYRRPSVMMVANGCWSSKYRKKSSKSIRILIWLLTLRLLIPLSLHSGPGVCPALLSVFFTCLSEGVQLQQQLQGGWLSGTRPVWHPQAFTSRHPRALPSRQPDQGHWVNGFQRNPSRPHHRPVQQLHNVCFSDGSARSEEPATPQFSPQQPAGAWQEAVWTHPQHFSPWPLAQQVTRKRNESTCICSSPDVE